MISVRRPAQLLPVLALSLVGCTGVPDPIKTVRERNQAIQELQRQAGAPVAFEVGETGDVRVLALAPGFSIPRHATDPVVVAQDFLATHRGVFQLDAADATQFAVTRVDHDPATGLHHVTLQRVFDGIPVYQGAITVHMDPGNRVFRALGDPFYHVTAPTNRMMLPPREAAIFAGRALGVALSPRLQTSEGQATTFSSPGTLDPLVVEPRIFQVAPDDSRFAYQVLVSWRDDQKQQQYQLAMVDAQDGTLLTSYSLINTFTGRVFNVNAQPTANQSADTRTVVSFDGDPAASPQGWVGAAHNTVGNNAVAATDIDGNNTVGANETQPVANGNNSFDFPYSATQNAQNFRAAAVANAFFLVNDYHDRTYKLGFTEASGNFQTSNFGKGGAQNDPVNVDVQDGSGTNNANFSTPPDGSRPRMQMFIFSIKNGAGGVTQDGAFDPTVIYHESTHGVSNRLVGGGSTGCLGGLQSGGMGEGWGDFMSGSFLNNPVVGAYVTGNATVGIRRQSMASSTWTYNDIKNGTLGEVHDVGELWAATLWSARIEVGAATIERLVVSGMKLTPCNPTMLQARDAIIQADANINAGANRCKLWTAFASRGMGTGASSPNHSSTTTIVPSNAVPAGCDGTPPPAGPTLQARCTVDRLDATAALQRIEWARRCALLTNTGGPDSWLPSDRAFDTIFISAKDYREVNVNRAYSGSPLDYGVNITYGVCRYAPTPLFTVFQETSGPTAGFWKWSHTTQRSRPLYPTFETTPAAGSGIPLFPLPTLPSECNLYQRDATTSAFSRWTGNFYVIGYCESD